MRKNSHFVPCTSSKQCVNRYEFVVSISDRKSRAERAIAQPSVVEDNYIEGRCPLNYTPDARDRYLADARTAFLGDACRIRREQAP